MVLFAGIFVAECMFLVASKHVPLSAELSESYEVLTRAQSALLMGKRLHMEYAQRPS